jgi:SapC protein
MTKLITLREVSHLRLLLDPQPGVCDDQWWPVSSTELHLVSLFFPLAIRFEAGRPSLGVLVAPPFLNRPLFDEAGRWRGGYRPLALRVAPFQGGDIGADPLDMLIALPSWHLVEQGGAPIVDANGAPSPLVREIHRWRRLLQDSQVKFATALDKLLIAQLLVPLAAPEGGSLAESPLHTVDAPLFASTDNKALAAMARHDFTALDVAVACLSSQRLLHKPCRPRRLAGPEAPERQIWIAHDSLPIEALDLVLDDSELVSIADIAVLREESRI